jgi:hypothetical protein
MTSIMMAIMLMLVLGSPANNVSVYAKKHTECFNSGVSDGKDHPFDASRFDRCGQEYESGFMKGCLSVQGNTKEACSSAEDNQD